MKQGKLLVALAALPLLAAGCDIFAPDSLDPPGIRLTGHVTFNGEPVPVRIPTGTTQLRLWQTDWEEGDTLRQLEQIGIALNTDGSYSALVYPGEYDIQQIANQGPWVSDTTRIPFVINGDMEVDVPVQPYYTIEDESIVFIPPAAGDTTGGAVRATFRVGQHVTTPLVELVGLYINTTQFVDRTRREPSILAQLPAPANQGSTALYERNRNQIQTQLTANQPITITLRLPSNIRLTRSPELRNTVYVRVGVKAVGVTELAYSPVLPLSIVP